MTTRTTRSRRRSSNARSFNPEPIHLDGTIDEIMPDLDPGWNVWRDQTADNADSRSLST